MTSARSASNPLAISDGWAKGRVHALARKPSLQSSRCEVRREFLVFEIACGAGNVRALHRRATMTAHRAGHVLRCVDGRDIHSKPDRERCERKRRVVLAHRTPEPEPFVTTA